MDLDGGVRRENDDTERGGNVPRAGQTEWSEVITLVTVDNVEIPPTNQQEDKSLSPLTDLSMLWRILLGQTGWRTHHPASKSSLTIRSLRFSF